MIVALGGGRSLLSVLYIEGIQLVDPEHQTTFPSYNFCIMYCKG